MWQLYASILQQSPSFALSVVGAASGRAFRLVAFCVHQLSSGFNQLRAAKAYLEVCALEL